MVLRSTQFDDVYFSADDGLAETHHVFLNGNALPHAWQGKEGFTIAETGFGTGLNFLATWKLFEDTAGANQRLHFISVEKYPLSKDEIETALAPWHDDLGDYCADFLSKYPLRVPGPHTIDITDRVTLTLWFGDIAGMIPEWTGQVDAWFLDGFTPAKNPEMWTQDLFETMARLSHANTTFATFTAAGDVRRGLEAAGFTVEKTKGFGRKRDMMRGWHNGDTTNCSVPKGQYKSIAIIGGGMAGCAMAYEAQKAGIKAIIFEASDQLAAGASGGRLGMVNPKLTAKPTPQCDYYTAAYAHALRVLPQFPDIDFAQTGTKHLCTNDDKNRRFTGYIDNLGWHGDHLYRDSGGHMIYPDAASVCPEKLCHALAQHAEIHLNTKICHSEFISESEGHKPLKQIQDDHDFIVFSNGHAVKDLSDMDLPVNWVRGQISWIKPQDAVITNISYGGYVTPQTSDGFHILGSTLDPKNDDLSLRDADHQEVLNRYNKQLNQTLTMDDIIGGWAALRTSSKDRFPIIGAINGNSYISTAHGSHGIISSLYGARILMSLIQGGHRPVGRHVLSALSPKRFHKH